MATTIDRGFRMADRYLFDMELCPYAKGWCQVDTTQDASYYGTWTNPRLRETISYCEGDVTRTASDTDEEYVQAVREMAAWHRDRGYWLGIDPGLVVDRRDQFVRLGLEPLLH